jgi:hypothetical protein
MWLLRWAIAGLLIGGLAGLVWFLIILFMPSNTPDNADGGAGLYIILLFIAAVFATVGGVVGCLIGLLLGGIYHLAMGGVSPARRPSERVPKAEKAYQVLDDLRE